MRILLYNWVPSGSPITEGGGVALYVDNLTQGLVAHGHAVDVLSSGFRYALTGGGPRIVRRRSRRSGTRYFDVMNSPVQAPSFFMFDDVARTLESPELVALLQRFIEREGPYDFVHIQNVEGLSFDVLELAEHFPKTRFVLTNHNYHVVCQQANLWRRDEVRCAGQVGGAACHTCNVFPIDMDHLAVDRFARMHRLDARLGKAAPLARGLLRKGVRLQRLAGRRMAWDREPARTFRGERVGPADLFRLRHRVALDLVNRHCSRVISVSKATEDILLRNGLAPELSRVSYIGTRHHDPQRPRLSRTAAPHLRLAFLGYTRPDKGFRFLAQAIEAMPKRLRGRLSLLVAARNSDAPALARIAAKRSWLADLTIQDGYAQAELPKLLSTIDLGLVLPQWDDALPQVAIEFVCHGVPILCSDRGGQQELAPDPAFVFPATSIDAFWTRIGALEADRTELDRFWTLPRPLRTNLEHVDELLRLYLEEEPPQPQVAPQAASTGHDVVDLTTRRILDRGAA